MSKEKLCLASNFIPNLKTNIMSTPGKDQNKDPKKTKDSKGNGSKKSSNGNKSGSGKSK